MLKRDELKEPTSCLNKALPDEMIFVLLGRDKAAQAAIRTWIGERLRLQLNDVDDAQIVNATDCLRMMEVNQASYKVASVIRGAPDIRFDAVAKQRQELNDEARST